MKSRLALAVFLGSILASFHATADDAPLTADKIRSLIVGHTTYSSVNGQAVRTYYGASGTLERSVNGNIVQGSYTVSADGTYCATVSGRATCGKVMDIGDGLYRHVDAAGKKIETWQKIVSGSELH